MAVNITYLKPGETWYRRLWSARELLWALALRDIQVRYKQSALGVAWAVVQPLSMAIILSLVGMIMKIPSEGIPYPVFMYGAMVPWTLFSSSLSSSIPSVVGHGSLITKVYFPREVLPIAAVVGCVFDFLTASFVLVPFMIFYRIAPSWHVVWIPLLLLMIMALVMGIGFAFSSINVFYRDIRSVVPLLVQLWMFASPVMYPVSAVPARFRVWYSLNPMVGIIDGFRGALLLHRSPDPVLLMRGLPLILLVLVFGYRVFTALERRFADVV